jgi:integrase
VPDTKAAGLQGLRIYDLRHTAVALWIAAGGRPRRVAMRAGHTSVSFALGRYGHQTIPWPVTQGRCHPVRD